MNTSIQADICVAFDLDDTLYKERDYVAEGRRNVARVMAERSGIDAGELFELMQNAQSDRIAQGSPSNGQAAFDLLHKRLQSTPAAIATVDDYLDIYRTTRPSLQLPKSTVSALERLREMGVTLGIITDGRHITQWNKIEALGLEKYIDHNNIIISDDIGYDKHSHRPFAELAGRIGAQRYIYVGDNLTKDFHYPRILGWTAVMLRDIDSLNIHRQDLEATEGAYRPDLIIDNLNELIPLCQQL